MLVWLEQISNNMTILFFSRLFYPHIGGVETHVMELAKNLIKKGNRVLVVTEKHDIDLLEYEVYKKIEIFRIPITKNKKIAIWKWLWTHRDLIELSDVVHAHDVGFWFFPSKILYPFKKFFITFHGYEGVFPPAQKAIFVRYVTYLLSRGSICVGNYIAKWYYIKPDVVLYGSPGSQKSEVRSQKSSKGNKLSILFVGRMDGDMGIRTFSRVLKKLKIEFEFSAIGDGSRRKQLEKYGKVMGFVDNVDTYIAKADIVFASSYLSILQSLSLGKPVIVVYENELKKDYLLDTPFAKWINVSNNPRELASKIESDTLVRPDRQTSKWLAHNTWECITKSYLDLWTK